MATTIDASLRQEFARLREECLLCYQCGQCTSSCPNGGDLERGPRRIIRDVQAGEIEAVMSNEDLWRCSECGTCSDVCRMDVDVAAILKRLRALERQYGGQRCPEREAADIAAKRLGKYPRIDNLAFGMTMASKGHVPKDVVGAAGAFTRIVSQTVNARMKAGRAAPEGAPAAAAKPAGPARPFYAGCALPQDADAYRRTHAVAAAIGFNLAETEAAACCGHPSRGTVGSGFTADEPVLTACPACDASLEEAGVQTTPLWEALVDRARRDERPLKAAAESFVPYVGCLVDRERALASLADAAALSGARIELSYPALHAACCGALGGMYRGSTEGARRLLGFAAERRAPVVTPCLLCRDNLRSAARRAHLSVPIHFWPEFFSAADAGSAAPTDGDAHD